MSDGSAEGGQERRPRAADTVLTTVAAAGAVGEAVVHVPVIAPHLSEAPYVGVAFILLAITGIILAIRLLHEPVEVVWVLSGVVATAALVGYLLSRMIGLPQLSDDVGRWDDPLGTAAVLCEFTMLLATVIHFARRPSHQ